MVCTATKSTSMGTDDIPIMDGVHEKPSHIYNGDLPFTSDENDEGIIGDAMSAVDEDEQNNEQYLTPQTVMPEGNDGYGIAHPESESIAPSQQAIPDAQSSHARENLTVAMYTVLASAVFTTMVVCVCIYIPQVQAVIKSGTLPSKTDTSDSQTGTGQYCTGEYCSTIFDNDDLERYPDPCSGESTMLPGTVYHVHRKIGRHVKFYNGLHLSDVSNGFDAVFTSICVCTGDFGTVSRQQFCTPPIAAEVEYSGGEGFPELV